MTKIEPFLEPISPDAPCGTDISYDQAFLDLEALARGKEETQFSPAEDPNWKDVQKAAIELLGKAKDLRLGMIATLAFLQIDGVPGFRNGLQLIKGWNEKYWDTLFPLLDPDDNNDPTQRVNMLQSLSTSNATTERFLERLTLAPLAESRSLGRYNLKTILEAAGKPEIDAAFRDSDQEQLKARYEAAAESLALVKELDKILAEKVGRDRSPNFAELTATLKQMADLMGPYFGAAPTEAAGETAGQTTGTARAGGAGASLGAIGSRGDVVKALQAICEYYKHHEPASPIPLLLERAKRLVDKDFMQIINDLSPESLTQISVITGSKPAENKQENT